MSHSDDEDPNLSLYHAIELLDGDTKQRLSALEIIQSHVDSNALGRDEINALSDAIVLLLKDNNFKVCVGALRVASVALAQAGEHSKAVAPLLVPALIERLGDGKAAVREGALEAIYVTINSLQSPSIVHERFNTCWKHKNAHIREGILKIAIHCFAQYGSKFSSSRQREVLVKDIVHLLGDSSSSVRESAMSCIEAAYSVLGNSLRNALKDYGIRSAHMKKINARLDQIKPQQVSKSEDMPLSSSSGNSPPNKQKQGKRGGFGDGGGVTNNGTITQVDPIYVKSAQDLQNRLEDIKENLIDTTENWQSRMQHMMNLEGIIFGNGKDFEILGQMLYHMKTCFIEQVLDRRSAVSRQACHLLTVIAEHMNSCADTIVEHLVPHLFKVVVISVQVQADAAHSAVKKMMRACHVGKLVNPLSSNLQSSRNAKLRLACIDFFHVILESWLKPEYEHYIGNFEAGLKSALSDASKDVRAKAREAFVMYKSEWPENATALFEGLSSSVQKAIAQTGKKNKAAMQNSRQSIRSKILKSDFAAQLVDSEADGDLNGDVYWPKKESHSLREEKVLRDRGDVGSASDEQTNTFSSGATRISRDDTLQASLSKSRNSDGNPSERVPLEKKGNYTSPRSNDQSSHAQRKLNGFSMKRYLESVGTKSLPWNVKVEMNGNFQEWILQQGQAIVNEVSGDIEKLVFIFMDHFNDPHHKVALSSLALFDQLLPLCLHILEPYVVKFCPPLFLKMVDNKEQIRASASEILMTMGERYSVDTLIPGLSRSLKSNKHPRSRIAVLEFSVKYFRKNTTTSAHVLEGWVALIGPLICEKVVEVRRAAAAAMVRIYQSVNAEPVLAYILSLAPGDQSVVRKAVHTFVGSIDAELASYAASQNIHNLSWLDKAAGGEEKRQSVEDEDVSIDLEDSTAAPTEATLTTSKDRVISVEPTEKEYQRPQSPASYGNFLQKARQLEAEEKGSKSHFALREKPFNMEMPDISQDVEMHDLELILDNLGKCNLRQDYSLKQFSVLSRKYPSSVWEVFCEETISKLLNYVKSSSPGVKAGGLLSVKEFAQNQPQLVSNALADIMSLVMGAVNEVHLEVKQSADECLMALAQSSNVELFVELVLDNLPSHMEDSSRKRALVSIFRSLGKALANLPLPELSKKLGDVLPYLFTSFNSTDADVRKAVVFCLVDIYSGMGNMLMPHLSPLSTAQLKLLTIYIQRSKKGSVYQATNGKENSAPIHSQLNPVYN